MSPRGCHRPCHIPGRGEGFVPPHSSARGSSGSTRSLLLLWIYRHARALQTGTRRPWAVPFPANWVCFLGTVSPQCRELRWPSPGLELLQGDHTTGQEPPRLLRVALAEMGPAKITGRAPQNHCGP